MITESSQNTRKSIELTDNIIYNKENGTQVHDVELKKGGDRCDS